jgi:predicted DCC family thiol-disulfide oxidoreductase YuxK
VITEITDVVDRWPRRGWVLYDGDCRMCTGLVRRFRPALARRGFATAALQESWVRRRLGRQPDDTPTEMILLEPGGRVRGGAEGVALIASRLWWAWPLYAAWRVPGIRAILKGIYRWIAARRHCVGGSCAPGARSGAAARAQGWAVLAILPCVAFAVRSSVPAWAFMWMLALALYAGCKWLTWWNSPRTANTSWRPAAYLFAWPGMDAGQFLRGDHLSALPRSSWLAALSRTSAGAALVWGAARIISAPHWLLAGWVGMVGMVLLLHFGSFELLALFWQRLGVDARPIMRRPIKSQSLAEFWGMRWNAGFRDLSHHLIFRPLCRRWSAAAATVAAFIASGLIHEMLISVPARAGYGLPTLYFSIQGAGLLIEKSRRGRSMIGAGWPGRLWTLAVTAGPAVILFHPPFVRNVFIPFMHAIGAI